MKIECCVFDFGGVMSPALYPDLVKPIAEGLGIEWNRIIDGYRKYRQRMDGDLITLREMYSMIFADIGVDVPEDAFAKILEADTATYFARNEDTLAWMRELKSAGFKIGILTNMNTPFSRHFKRVFADFVELADALVVSGEEHLFKPMREIYEVAAKRLGIEPAKICFFDDVEENCQGARNAGWNAIRFSGVAATKKAFKELTSPENHFLAAAADVLEMDGVGLDTRFRDVPEWSSLKAFGLLVMMESRFAAPLKIDGFMAIETLGGLYRFAVKHLIARVLGVAFDSLGDNPRYGEPPEWDSVNHLRIAMEMEKAFGVKYPIERIPALLSLDELSKE